MEKLNLTVPVQWKEAKEFKRILWPDGLYPGYVKEIQDGGKGEHGQLIRIIFSVTHPELGVGEIPYVGYPVFTPKSRMGKAAKALGMKEGEPFPLATLIGKHCQLLLQAQTWKKDGKDVTGSSIENLLPIAQMKVVTAHMGVPA